MASLEFLFAAFAEMTGRQPIGLLSLEHQSFSTLRYCTGHNPVLSRGILFSPMWFTIRFPSVSESGLRAGELVMDNTTDEPIASLRTSTSPVRVIFEFVLANTTADPAAQDRLEAPPARWFIRPGGSYTASEFRARLGFSNVLGEAWPQIKFTPNTFPGVF